MKGGAKFIVKCAMCFVACFERCMRYLNRQAYIEVVIRNINFCSAVAKTVSLLTGNFLRFGVLTGIVGIFLVLSSIFITLVVTFIGYYVLKGIGDLKNEEYETVGPIIVIAIIAFAIAQFFNYIFSVSADTMLHCFIYEEENPGSRRGNCPDSLREAVNSVSTNAPNPI